MRSVDVGGCARTLTLGPHAPGGELLLTMCLLRCHVCVSLERGRGPSCLMRDVARGGWSPVSVEVATGMVPAEPLRIGQGKKEWFEVVSVDSVRFNC